MQTLSNITKKLSPGIKFILNKIPIRKTFYYDIEEYVKKKVESIFSMIILKGLLRTDAYDINSSLM